MTHQEALNNFLNTPMSEVSAEIPPIAEGEHLVLLEVVRQRPVGEGDDARMTFSLQFRIAGEDELNDGADRGRVFFGSIWPTRIDGGDVIADPGAQRTIRRLVEATLGDSSDGPLAALEAIAASGQAFRMDTYNKFDEYRGRDETRPRWSTIKAAQ